MALGGIVIMKSIFNSCIIASIMVASKEIRDCDPHAELKASQAAACTNRT